MKNERTVIISDLHVSSGKLDDCDKILDDCICQFFRHTAGDKVPTEIIINGDFLDFVQAFPWEGRELRGRAADGTALCFTEAQSRLKFKSISEAHPSIFQAMAEFLGKDNSHSITILP